MVVEGVGGAEAGMLWSCMFWCLCHIIAIFYQQHPAAVPATTSSPLGSSLLAILNTILLHSNYKHLQAKSSSALEGYVRLVGGASHKHSDKHHAYPSQRKAVHCGTRSVFQQLSEQTSSVNVNTIKHKLPHSGPRSKLKCLRRPAS